MVNIPGIIGYSIPGAFSELRVRANAVSLPGNPTIVAIIGEGKTEEILVSRAKGNGADGLNVDFATTGSPDGRHFKISDFPVVPGSFELFLNPTGLADVPLVRLDSLTDVLRAAPLTLAVGTNSGSISSGGTQFSDSGATFQTNGVLPGDQLVITNGTSEGKKFEVQEVLSETVLVVSRAASLAIASASYRVERIIDNAGDGYADDGQFWQRDYANYISSGLRTSQLPSSTTTEYNIVGDGVSIGGSVALAILDASSVVGLDFTTGAGSQTGNPTQVDDIVNIAGQALKVVSVAATTLTLDVSTAFSVPAGTSFTITRLNPAQVGITDGTAVVSGTPIIITGINGLTSVSCVAGATAVYATKLGTLGAAVIQPKDTLLLAIIRTTQNTDGVVIGVQVLSNTAITNVPTNVPSQQSNWGVDGIKGLSDASVWEDGYAPGFFDSPAGRRFGRNATLQGATEPQHYVFDDTTGEVILDRALSFRDRLVVSYIPVANLNTPELFSDPIALYNKHGYPNQSNTLATAAQLAFQNGASLVLAVQGGLKLEGLRYVRDVGFSEALTALEREDVNIVVPIEKTDIEEEIVIPFYNPQELINTSAGIMMVSEATVGGTILMEDNTADSDIPGLNITPLELDPDDDSLPKRLQVFRNGREMVFGTDYTVPNLDGSIYTHPVFGPSTNTAIVLTEPLLIGEKITASYRPKREVIDLVATTQQAAVLHVEQMSSITERAERIMMTGAPEFADKDFLTDSITGIEANFGTTKRCVYIYPNTGTMIVNNQVLTIDGQYMAAAAAGKMASQSIEQPLTKRTIIGFTLPPSTKLSMTEQNLLGGAGLSLLKPLAAGGQFIVGRTTINTGNPNEEEPSIVRIGDRVSQVMREILENRFVGTIITVQTESDVKTAAIAVLESLIAQRLITNYANVSVRQDLQDPRQVNVTFDVAPAYPLNYIYITLTVGVIT